MRPESHEFAFQQARSTLTTLYALIGDRWLSHPDSIRAAADKVQQLRRAAAAGLTVPGNLISNDPERVVGFHDGNVRLGHGTAVKSLWARKPVSYDGGLRVPLTTVWPENVDPAQAATIRLAPAVFQEYVPKQREIRVVVIGTRVFAAAVNSQAVPEARHDVRAATRKAVYEPYDLPPGIGAALLEVVRGFGLRFCSADLVLTPDGEYVFLDLNPNGQWLWLEIEAGLPLSAAMADLLSQGIPADRAS